MNKILIQAILMLTFCYNSVSADTNSVTYVRDVFPIVMTRCFPCHNPASRLPNWTDYKTMFRKKVEVKRRIWDSWSEDALRHYYKQPMPAGYGAEGLAVTLAERETIKKWVELGAPYGVDVTPVSVGSTNTGWVAPLEASNIHNPIPPNEEVIAKGKSLFTFGCVPCHGEKGKGDGVAAPSLQRDNKPLLPANLGSQEFQSQSDGSFFWKIKEGRNPMPSWRSALTDEQCWQIIDYLRTLRQ
jgi:mono/diheme cytochrome c family protein